MNLDRVCTLPNVPLAKWCWRLWHAVGNCEQQETMMQVHARCRHTSIVM